MKIVVASKNPVKIRAALKGFKKMFPGEKFEVDGKKCRDLNALWVRRLIKTEPLIR